MKLLTHAHQWTIDKLLCNYWFEGHHGIEKIHCICTKNLALKKLSQIDSVLFLWVYDKLGSSFTFWASLSAAWQLVTGVAVLQGARHIKWAEDFQGNFLRHCPQTAASTTSSTLRREQRWSGESFTTFITPSCSLPRKPCDNNVTNWNPISQWIGN